MTKSVKALLPETLVELVKNGSRLIKPGVILLDVKKGGKQITIEQLSQMKPKEGIGAKITLLGKNVDVTDGCGGVRYGWSLGGVTACAKDSESVLCSLEFLYGVWRAYT